MYGCMNICIYEYIWIHGYMNTYIYIILACPVLPLLTLSIPSTSGLVGMVRVVGVVGVTFIHRQEVNWQAGQAEA